MISTDDRLSFEKSEPGRSGVRLQLQDAKCDRGAERTIPSALARQSALAFPEMNELETVRHFVNLSKKNFSIDTHFYPLGSCTMKYNPKVNEWAASLEGFSKVHPFQPEATCQGALEILGELQRYLAAITGMDRFTLQPAAGAHGELTGMMLVHAYHHAKKESHRNKVLVPDSSHGTNPASASLLGYEVIQIRSNARGRVDLEDLKKHLGPDVACLMLTNPNTLGLFEEQILEVTRAVHEAGGLLYYDGANLNALLGLARPGDMGFDIVHVNLHKTFSTLHGGGGPGAGPVGVKDFLAPFLPLPWVVKQGESYRLIEKGESSIGRVGSFFGNFGILLRAYAYIRTLGTDGLRKASRAAILNANYLKSRLKKTYDVPVDEPCMHEFVMTSQVFKEKHLHASDIGKRLLDMGFHAPTVHFPLVVEDAIMIEPTETESKETLDRFVEALIAIRKEIDLCPETVRNAPHHMPIHRPDEVQAARQPILTYRDYLGTLRTTEPRPVSAG
ncbi:MAG: aminomethyl-transferring glycine dehydrogenase subunit GcvPB [Candidatus Omnitrophota bacterium]